MKHRPHRSRPFTRERPVISDLGADCAAVWRSRATPHGHGDGVEARRLCLSAACAAGRAAALGARCAPARQVDQKRMCTSLGWSGRTCTSRGPRRPASIPSDRPLAGPSVALTCTPSLVPADGGRTVQLRDQRARAHPVSPDHLLLGGDGPHRPSRLSAGATKKFPRPRRPCRPRRPRRPRRALAALAALAPPRRPCRPRRPSPPLAAMAALTALAARAALAPPGRPRRPGRPGRPRRPRRPRRPCRPCRPLPPWPPWPPWPPLPPRVLCLCPPALSRCPCISAPQCDAFAQVAQPLAQVGLDRLKQVRFGLLIVTRDCGLFDCTSRARACRRGIATTAGRFAGTLGLGVFPVPCLRNRHWQGGCGRCPWASTLSQRPNPSATRSTTLQSRCCATPSWTGRLISSSASKLSAR